MDQGSIQVAALYRFCRMNDPEALRASLAVLCQDLGIKGTLLLANEGINGTVAGSGTAIASLLVYLRSLPGLENLEAKLSSASRTPFHRMKVRLKAEIVTMGVPDVDPVRGAGTYVAPGDWNELISDPDTLVIDTRNGYEVALGTFSGAVDPGTETFRDFPAWAERNRAAFGKRRVAMFCTGGIRCEKATAYVRSLGVQDVFHLRGGILQYLEDIPASESLWQGECFVFDERVSVSHGLEEGAAELCRACRHPLKAADRASPAYRAGVSCGHCLDSRSERDRERYLERHRQVAIAAARGQRHVGS